MNSNQKLEVRFTAKRACVWNHTGWKTISADKARDLIALGQAREIDRDEFDRINTLDVLRREMGWAA